MSNELSPKCPQCGTSLPGNAPAGLCPNCLMALNLKTETVFTDIPVTAQPPLPPEQIAPHFPQLEILECLGRGGMGVVYKARQKTLNRLVALKLLAPERVNDTKFADRFAREAQALAALNHPNIVTIHDFGQAGGFYFLLMEFVDGVNLRQLLRARKFAPEEALAIVPPICEALQYAHDRGIVHRDIKPENLLLDKQGKVKIADFGIAKMLGTKNGDSISNTPENATQSALGTPGYNAPEQKTDPQRADNRADIYSLGVVFYEMLTGELPGKRIEPPSKKIQVDVRLDAVVLRALEKNPELRWQTAEDLRTQVETIAAYAPCPQTGARPKLNFSRASVAAIACGAITLIMCVLAMLAENHINSLAPEMDHLENSTSLSDRYSPVIQSWSNLIHLRRYVIIPSIFIGVLAGVFFAGIAASQTSSPARRKAIVIVSVLTLIALYLDIAFSLNGGFRQRAKPEQSSTSESSQLDTQAGWQLWQERKLDQAAAMFNKAIQGDSNNVEAWNGLGWATFNSGHPSDAEKDFQKVLSLNPTHAAALNGLGQIYLSQRKYEDAEKYLLQAAPQAPAAWYGLARLYLLEGKYDDAEKWAQKAVDSGQGDQTANEMLKAAQNKQLPDALRISIEPQSTPAGDASALNISGVEAFLKYKWPVGKSYVFDFDYKQDTALLLQGRSNTVDEAVTMGSQSRVTVLSGTPDGGHELELQALSARMGFKLGDDTILDYNSANQPVADPTNGVAAVFEKIVGSKIRYIVNASNNVEQVKGMDELVQQIQSVPQTDPLTTKVKKIFNAAFFDTFTNNNHLLPPQALQPGDTWSSHFEHPVAGVGIEAWDYKIVFQNWEMHGNHTCARLDLQGTMNVKSDPTLKRDEKVYHPRDGVAQGISWFDPKLGQVIEIDMKQDLNVDKLPRNPTPAQQGQLITTQRHVVYTFKLEE